MKITTAKTPLSALEIAEALRSDFSGQYTCTLFGFGNQKSVTVRKKPFVRAHISKRAHEISIEGTPPPLAATVLSVLLGAAISHPWALFLPAPWKRLEKEIGRFLYRKYNA